MTQETNSTISLTWTGHSYIYNLLPKSKYEFSSNAVKFYIKRVIVRLEQISKLLILTISESFITEAVLQIALTKWCSENMPHIYRQYDLNNVALHHLKPQLKIIIKDCIFSELLFIRIPSGDCLSLMLCLLLNSCF